MACYCRPKPLRVLFVGNSQFNCVSDIPEIVEEMSRSAKDRKVPLILAEETAIGGVGLEGYWNTGLPQKRIAAGGWDWVVTNDIVYSYGGNTAKFREYAKKFAEAFKAPVTLVKFTGRMDIETVS